MSQECQLSSRLSISFTDPEIFSLGATHHGSITNGHPPATAATELGPIVSRLLQASLQPSSVPTYKRAWKHFCKFLGAILPGTSSTLPLTSPTIALFIAYLFDRKYAPTTVNTYVSAIGYIHKISGFPDPTKAFFLTQMLKGYGKLGSRLDSRLPITLPILHRIVTASTQLVHGEYMMYQFQAMCLFAFYTFARIGEITASQAGHTI